MNVPKQLHYRSSISFLESISMVVKLGQNLLEMIMCVADVAKEKQHGRCSNNPKQSNHRIKTFSQVLLSFFFSKSRDKLSYPSFPTVCGRGPINIAPNQAPAAALSIDVYAWDTTQSVSLLGWLGCTLPISNLHACKIQARRFHRCYNYLKVALHWMEDPTQQSDWLIDTHRFFVTIN